MRRGPSARGTRWTSAQSTASDNCVVYGEVECRAFDRGAFYAAKDFWDPKGRAGGRRVLWSWARVYEGAQTLPRELTYDARLERLLSNPIAELEQLRGAPLARVVARPIDAATCPRLDWSATPARTLEVLAYFARPETATTFGLKVGDDGPDATFAYTDAAAASATLSGAADDVALPLLPSDDVLQLRLFVDTSFAEAFFAHGRVALTGPANNATFLDNPPPQLHSLAPRLHPH